MKIRSFRHDAQDIGDFIDAGQSIRGGDRTWSPPSRAELEHALSPRNPFFSHGELRSFLAEDGGRVAGRCAAMIDSQHVTGGAPTGMVGFYECERGPEASKALLDVALAWLKERGVRTVLGPMNFSIWHSYRFMTRGFDREAFLGEPRNPPHYPEQFEAAGFEPHARYYSWDLTEDHLRGMLHVARKMAVPGALAEAGLTCRPMDMERFDEQLAHVHRLLVDAFRENTAFTPISLEEFRGIFGGMKALAIPELVPLMWTAQGEAVGFGYLFPDHLQSKGTPDRLIFHTVAVQKEYRRKGMVETVLVDLLRHALERGFRSGVGALAKEGPTLYSKTGEPSREYVLYRRAL